MAKIKVAGLDGSLSNFGVSIMIYDTETDELTVDSLHLFKTEPSKIKSVRVSSDKLARAQMIVVGVKQATAGCAVCFAEIPSGGQSASAVWAFGMVTGIYAALSIDIPLIEVAPNETKVAAVGTKTASKEEMIDWAFNLYPNAPWRLRKLKGELVPKNDNEHLADGCGVVHAGINLPQFRQVIAIHKATAAAA